MSSERVEALLGMMNELVAAPRVVLGELLKTKPAHAKVSGVYAISPPGSNGSIVYVGRTKTKTVLGRMQDHCRIATSSDLAGMLPRHAQFPQDPLSYEVRWLEVENDVERAQLELFAIAVISPPFNRYG